MWSCYFVLNIKIWYEFLFLFSQERLFLKKKEEEPCSVLAGTWTGGGNPGIRQVQVDTYFRAWLDKESSAAPKLDTSPVITKLKELSSLPNLNNLWEWQFPVKMLCLWRHTFAQDITLYDATGHSATDISWESITTIIAPKNHSASTWTDGSGSVKWNHTTCPLILTLKVKTRTRGRRGSRRCPPGNAFPLLIFQPCHQLMEVSLQVTEGLFSGLWRLWHQGTLLHQVQVFLLQKKASNCWVHWCCQLYLRRVKFQYDCTWVKTVLHSKNLVILSFFFFQLYFHNFFFFPHSWLFFVPLFSLGFFFF